MSNFDLALYLVRLAITKPLVEVPRMEAGEKEKGGVAP